MKPLTQHEPVSCPAARATSLFARIGRATALACLATFGGHAAIAEDATPFAQPLSASAASDEERAAIQALGFSADDPVSIAAWREEAGQPEPYQPFDASGYVPDPSFNHGRYFEDAFSANQNGPNNDFAGKKVARLANGDIVVAALVKNPNGNQTNAYYNLGLVRYNAAGTMRLTWPGAGAYGSASNQYVVYPKLDSADTSWIQDIKVIDDFILVSINRNWTATDVDTAVVVFRSDGAFVERAAIFSRTDAEYVGGMEVYKTSDGIRHVVVVGTRIPASGNTTPRPLYSHYTLGNTGHLASVDGQSEITLAYGACAGANENCQPKGIALGYPALIGLSPVIFVALNKPAPNANTTGDDIVVLGINPSGTALSNWAGGWWNLPGDRGNKNDTPFGIAVKSTGLGISGSPRIHTVYVAANSSRECASGISVLRQSTSDNGATAQATLFGGSAASAALCAALKPARDIGNGVAMQDGKLAIAGMRVAPSILPLGEDRVDGEFALVDDLTVTAPLTTYPFQIGSPRDKHTGLFGIVGTGNGKFVATGDDRFRDDSDVPASLRGKKAVVTLGLGADLIFADGFD